MSREEVIYMNIALNLFAFVIVIIIFASCLMERASTKKRSSYLTVLMGVLAILLAVDALSWVGEGLGFPYFLPFLADNISACAGQIVILCFLGYLKVALFPSSVVAEFLLKMVKILCLIFVLLVTVVVVSGFHMYLGQSEHHRIKAFSGMGTIYLIIPAISVLSVFGMLLFAKAATKGNRIVLVLYLMFPVVGVLVDYYFFATSFTYLGLVVSAVLIYTQIYLKKQKLIESQRNSLMISQINPHFLYNTLSTIASMCELSPKQAKNLTIDFAQYLRGNIDTLTSEGVIPFEEELKHVECYLKIEKARFRERLNIVYSIDCKHFSLPPLTVQPLVENAVKHGITKRIDGGTVKISTREANNCYVIEIIDDGVGFDTESVEGRVGIENVRERIAVTCRGELTVKSTAGVGTRITIEIPKKRRIRWR